MWSTRSRLRQMVIVLIKFGLYITFLDLCVCGWVQGDRVQLRWIYRWHSQNAKLLPKARILPPSKITFLRSKAHYSILQANPCQKFYFIYYLFHLNYSSNNIFSDHGEFFSLCFGRRRLSAVLASPFDMFDNASFDISFSNFDNSFLFFLIGPRWCQLGHAVQEGLPRLPL